MVYSVLQPVAGLAYKLGSNIEHMTYTVLVGT